MARHIVFKIWATTDSYSGMFCLDFLCWYSLILLCCYLTLTISVVSIENQAATIQCLNRNCLSLYLCTCIGGKGRKGLCVYVICRGWFSLCHTHFLLNVLNSISHCTVLLCMGFICNCKESVLALTLPISLASPRGLSYHYSPIQSSVSKSCIFS